MQSEEQNMPKISIVVPIYNVEKYLHQCVDSILTQTLKDIEVVLVDDGSPDKCPQICDEYADKDKRVRVIHQPNGGYGKAVNNGIATATGDYIGIVESDDWIEPNMYEKLYASAEKFGSDMVKCRFYNFDSFRNPQDKSYGRKKYQLQNIVPDDRAFNIFDYPLLLAYHSSVWAALYKKDFIQNLRFQETRSAAYQDFPFTMIALVKAAKISAVYDELLHYRQEEGNASSTRRTDQRLIVMAEQALYARQELKKLGVFDRLKEEFYLHVWGANYGFYEAIDAEYKKAYFDKLHEVFRELKDDVSFKFKYLKKHKKLIQAFIDGDFVSAQKLFENRQNKKITLFGIPLFQKIKNGNVKSYYLGSVKIFSKLKN